MRGHVYRHLQTRFTDCVEYHKTLASIQLRAYIYTRAQKLANVARVDYSLCLFIARLSYTAAVQAVLVIQVVFAMEVTLKEYLDRPLESYCSEILSEWRNMNKINVPVKSMSR